MKKIIIFVFSVISFCFLFVGNARAANTVLNISGGGEHKANSEFPVNVVLNPGGKKICAIGFTLTYPQDILTLKGTPTFGSDVIMSTEKDISNPGKIYYQLGITGCTTSNLTLLVANFLSAKNGSGSFNFSAIEAYGGIDGETKIDISGGMTKFSVPEVSTSESTGTTATPTPTPTSNYTSTIQSKVKNLTSAVEAKTKVDAKIILAGAVALIILVSIIFLVIHEVKRRKLR